MLPGMPTCRLSDCDAPRSLISVSELQVSWSVPTRLHTDFHVGHCHNRAPAGAYGRFIVATASTADVRSRTFLEENSLDEYRA